MQKETVGKIATDLSEKAPESRDPIELAREMQKDYFQELLKCVDEGKKTHPGNFFVVIITKNEPLLKNVFRNYFFCRLSCPTPDYDQTVFLYKKNEDELHYIWTIPSRDAAFHLRDNAVLVHKEERDLLNFVLQFADGTLYQLCQSLNKEHAMTEQGIVTVTGERA